LACAHMRAAVNFDSLDKDMHRNKTPLNKRLNELLSSPPDGLSPEGLSFYAYCNTLFLFTLTVHILFIPLFILIGYYPFLAVNIACACLNILALYLNRKAFLRLSTLVFLAYMCFLITMSIIVFGWGSGLFLYYITMTEIIFFSPWRLWQKVCSQSLFALAAIATGCYAMTHPPVVHLSSAWQMAIYIINIVVNSSGLAYSTYYYLRVAEEADRKLKYHATHDFLTGIFNRNEITTIMEKECARALRHGGTLSVIICDIDHFKRVNDTYGHIEGDRVIREAAGIMLSCLRNSDYLGRFGGEEFIILLPGIRARDASLIAERIRATIEHARIMTAKGVVSITMSMGIASSEHLRKPNADQILNAADEALYTAKHDGRNRAMVYGKQG
jgi:diguanylate cyclase (GGDEF)-like protein